MAEKYDFLFKCVVLGDGGCGKTAIVVRFSQGFFKENYKMTIGVEFAVKSIEVLNSQNHNYNVKLQIWDTGGQDRFQFVRPLYYKGAMGCIILYDITNRESFDHIPRWIEEIRKEVGEIPTLIVGNKSDLHEHRVVSRKEGEKFAKKLNFLYAESSAKNGLGVGDIFEILALMMIGEEVPDKLIKANLKATMDSGSEKIETTTNIKPEGLAIGINDKKPSIASPLSNADFRVPINRNTSIEKEVNKTAAKSNSLFTPRPPANPFIPRNEPHKIKVDPPIKKEADFFAPAPPKKQPIGSFDSSGPKPPQNNEFEKNDSFRPKFASQSNSSPVLKTSTAKTQNPFLASENQKEVENQPFLAEDKPNDVPKSSENPFIPFAKPDPNLVHTNTPFSIRNVESAIPKPTATNPFVSSKTSSSPTDMNSSPIDPKPQSKNPFIFHTNPNNETKSNSSFNERKPFVSTRDSEEKSFYHKNREIIEKNLQLNTESKTFTQSTNPFLTPKQSSVPIPPKKDHQDGFLIKSTSDSPKKIVCEKCGHVLPRKYKYCNKCGAVIR